MFVQPHVMRIWFGKDFKEKLIEISKWETFIFFEKAFLNVSFIIHVLKQEFYRKLWNGFYGWAFIVNTRLYHPTF